MTENLSSLEAAIAAGLKEATAMDTGSWIIFDAGRQAFAAYREQVARLQAENARLREFVQSLVDFEQDWDFPSAGFRGFINQAEELLADVTEGGEQ